MPGAVAALTLALTGVATAGAPDERTIFVSTNPSDAAAFREAMAAGKTEEALRMVDSLAPGSAAMNEALLEACRAGKPEIAGRALAAGVPDASVGLPLAVERNDVPMAELLVRYGADASGATGSLHAALKHRNARMLELLLNAGADPNEADAAGVTCLGAALTAGEIDLAKAMFRHGGQADEFLEPALARGDSGLLSALFQSGVSPATRDGAGNPLIVRAAMDGNAALVKLLLESGADPLVPGKEGQGALHFAVVTRNMDVLRALLDGGADPNQAFFSPVRDEFFERIDNELFRKWLKKDSNLTALMLAASRGDVAMLQLLIEKGAKRGLQTKGWKRYPVVFACDAEQIPAAQVLLGRKFTPSEPVHTVTISLSKQKATLYRNDEVVRTCTVSTGRKGFATPTGKFVITDKQRDWISTIYKVSMPFFMRLNCREIGLHAGNCPGYPASHGCIRMPHAEVQKLFATLKIGDAVTIVE